ncbi:MAG TPA: cysteine dioxygenase family protein [Pyrinomonadaceae bacterium]|jgi:cysteine dioxygenase|nr:cysteine dioxygenase family protein [Pyrinomonadaceae bacterium]
MSTNVTQTNAALPTAEQMPARRFSLDALTQTLAALKSAPTQKELDALLRRLELEPEELRGHLKFKPNTYTRHRLFRSDLCEMLVLCWLPGQRTAIHDHNGSYGAIRICQGAMEEEIFRLNEAGEVEFETMYVRSAGDVTGTDVPDIHRIGNPEQNAERMVTIHVYAPPLRVIKTYQLGSAEVGECWPDDPANPANT